MDRIPNKTPFSIPELRQSRHPGYQLWKKCTRPSHRNLASHPHVLPIYTGWRSMLEGGQTGLGVWEWGAHWQRGLVVLSREPNREMRQCLSLWGSSEALGGTSALGSVSQNNWTLMEPNGPEENPPSTLICSPKVFQEPSKYWIRVTSSPKKQTQPQAWCYERPSGKTLLRAVDPDNYCTSSGLPGST